MKTGGGPPDKKTEDGNTSAILTLISRELETLENRFDSDEPEILPENAEGTVVISVPAPSCSSSSVVSPTNHAPSKLPSSSAAVTFSRRLKPMNG
ncbi:hypothetical protein E2C01_072701 [Portunus trituberculatus]|uniref:Uncharacterized protein n=1 Tax=Portunus trituberculatus TaxID=210409 RepID=A0A5B7IBE5_PORTR|nr:hypothetical protein [Portunus trituberculatus]